MEAWNELMQNVLAGNAGAQLVADESGRLGLTCDIERAEALQKMRALPLCCDEAEDPFGNRDEGEMEAELFGPEPKAPLTATATSCQGMLNG